MITNLIMDVMNNLSIFELQGCVSETMELFE